MRIRIPLADLTEVLQGKKRVKFTGHVVRVYTEFGAVIVVTSEQNSTTDYGSDVVPNFLKHIFK